VFRTLVHWSRRNSAVRRVSVWLAPPDTVRGVVCGTTTTRHYAHRRQSDAAAKFYNWINYAYSYGDYL
jgi:hypothetical protein